MLVGGISPPCGLPTDSRVGAEGGRPAGVSWQRLVAPTPCEFRSALRALAPRLDCGDGPRPCPTTPDHGIARVEHDGTAHRGKLPHRTTRRTRPAPWACHDSKTRSVGASMRFAVIKILGSQLVSQPEHACGGARGWGIHGLRSPTPCQTSRSGSGSTACRGAR